MSNFIRLLADSDKSSALSATCRAYRSGDNDERMFWVDPRTFSSIPGRPFAYWITDPVRCALESLPAFEKSDRVAEHGASTKDDFRFLRVSWEILDARATWLPFAKGGGYSPFYSDISLLVNWQSDAKELEASLLHKYPYLGESANWVLHRECRYGHPGLTWTKRTKRALSMRVMPAGCVFSDKGSAVFVLDDSHTALLALLAICSSSSFRIFVELQLAAADARPGGAASSYEVGVIQRSPMPVIDKSMETRLAQLAQRGWSLMRKLDTVQESSHVFMLPAAIQSRAGDFDPRIIERELLSIEAEIDRICFQLYSLTEADQKAMNQPLSGRDSEVLIDDDEEDEAAVPADSAPSLLSWAVGVVFGHFDLRLATDEREAPPEPDPFDPLSAKSPGMLPDGATPFHAHAGILVDDPGHGHDLVRLVEDVLARVEMPAQDDLRRWLQKEFFTHHLQRYSKSRRKAPIYWPLATASGNYTLWLYYPSLTRQTLYTAINDFVEPKLAQVAGDVAALRNKGSARSRDEEKRFEAAESLELELIELRDQLLKIAPGWHPNHDDGVQITAAPLWPLFRHKPWQKILKETWAKLEKGDYDWAHLAMSYWPERVRAKCQTDKSLAIAHGLEALYIEPPAKLKKNRAKKDQA